MRLPIILMVFSCLVLPSGCSFKPVRHLASDAALIKAGESTRKDVLRYLGEPDSRRTVSPGVEEYVYAEDQRGQLGNLPWVGRMIDPERRETVVVTLNGDQVVSCEFQLSKKDDHEWKEDVDWDYVK